MHDCPPCEEPCDCDDGDPWIDYPACAHLCYEDENVDEFLEEKDEPHLFYWPAARARDRRQPGGAAHGRAGAGETRGVMVKPRLLDLFCGAGGSARGYQQAGFYVVGVDIKRQPRYCGDEFVQADALDYVHEHGAEFDVIHASPPCQGYSWATPVDKKHLTPKLIGVVRELLAATGRPWIIENVAGARSDMGNAVMLCGTMFGLPIWRHRYFETAPIWLMSPMACLHDFAPVLVTGITRRKGCRRVESSVALRRQAIGIEWMTTSELDQAIPPAYTKWLGQQVMLHINGGSDGKEVRFHGRHRA